MLKYRKTIISMSVILLLILSYWLKCFVGIDLIKSVHFSKFIPFLAGYADAADVLITPARTGLLFEDTFDSLQPSRNWQPLWMREQGKVKRLSDHDELTKSNLMLIESQSKQDWAYPHAYLIEVKEGDVYGYMGAVKSTGDDVSASFSVAIYDGNKTVIKWDYARETFSETKEWQSIQRRFMIPKGVKYIKFRLAGSDVGKVWFKNIRFAKDDYQVPRNDKSDQSVTLHNDYLSYKIDFKREILSVVDKRTKVQWHAVDIFQTLRVVNIEQQSTNRIVLDLLDPETLGQITVLVSLADDSDTVYYEIRQAAGSRFLRLSFPPSFILSENMQIVLPVGEGMLIPSSSLPPLLSDEFRGYQGHAGLTMPWFGIQANANAGLMVIVETPDDMKLRLKSDASDRLSPQIIWESQKGAFGYTRKAILKFIADGNYVEMAKQYRTYAQSKGLLKTLNRKQSLGSHNIDKLVGAVDVWYFGNRDVSVIEQFYREGLRKVLWSSHETSHTTNRILEQKGYLSARYDNYQDVYPPGSPQIWKDGWPDGLLLDRRKKRIVAWTDKRNGKEYKAYHLCSQSALDIAKRRIFGFLLADKYSAHFIDTIAASDWLECYHTAHPTTRTSDKENKMELLMASASLGLVVGAEGGIAPAVPYVSYFEGMLSLSPYRLKGGDVVRGYSPPTSAFMTYQVGPKYRVPLWELVFHDCVVSTWWWGDSNNKAPEAWHLKDLYNILYGTMPMWVIKNDDYFQHYRSRFVEGYKKVNPVFERVGYSEMTMHEFISPDRAVQRTSFSNGSNVYVNFSSEPYRVNAAIKLPPYGYAIVDHNKIIYQGQFEPLSPPSRQF